MRTDLWYWSWALRSLISLLPFGKPTHLAIKDMRGFFRRLKRVVRFGLREKSPSPQQERFLMAWADVLMARIQDDINKNMVDDFREAYHAAELQKGS